MVRFKRFSIHIFPNFCMIFQNLNIVLGWKPFAKPNNLIFCRKILVIKILDQCKLTSCESTKVYVSKSLVFWRHKLFVNNMPKCRIWRKIHNLQVNDRFISHRSWRACVLIFLILMSMVSKGVTINAMWNLLFWETNTLNWVFLDL